MKGAATMLNGNPVSFLTAEENACLAALARAQKLFDTICAEQPQVATDSYNFGHYIDAARNSVIMRGARRMDPDTLLPKAPPPPTIVNAALEGKVHIPTKKHGEKAGVTDGN
ncbi:hypothetical protein [uncultured Duncaniella sp.]|uniref:hypothetical protein n=1 Tax=uncultured Duncaniella sp. TaxID=2768039 RepID=UPI0026090217|nr:hypothetical protein [uncultured Duncaniella sp.]